MRTIIHDLDETYDSLFKSKCENVNQLEEAEL